MTYPVKRMKAAPIAVEERFWFRVDITPNGCWNWVGAGSSDYPRFQGGMDWVGTSSCPRIAWILHKGPVPEDMHIHRTCGNSACVNPDHCIMDKPASTSRKKCKGAGRPERAVPPEVEAEVLEKRAEGWSYGRIERELKVTTWITKRIEDKYYLI